MIQRIQTVFLSLAALLGAGLFFVPVQSYTDLQSQAVPVHITDSNVYLALACILILVACIAIFLFKRRPLQMRVSLFGALLSAVFIALVFLLPAQVTPIDDTGGQMHYNAGAWMLIAITLLFSIAARFIKKDEELVRSADRIR